ncbi:MAG: ATP-binding protein [Firmicutes bacterium]|nr:ATP-binding protein [Bacillota bacterium]
MLHTLETVRSTVRNRDGKRVFFLPKGDILTSEARDFLTAEHIEIREGRGEIPSYTRIDGGVLAEKPENLTHLRGNVLVPKTHPRIVLRGRMDTLEASLLVAQKNSPAPFAGELGELLDFARHLIRYEVMEEPVPQKPLLGLTSQQQREHSHHPERYYGQGHFMPSAEDSQALLSVNLARCMARQAELAAVEAFTDRDGLLLRADLVEALNRLSSLLWILMIRMKAESGKR